MSVDESRVDILVVQLKDFLESELSAGVVLVLDIFEAEILELTKKGLKGGGSSGFSGHVQDAPCVVA
jgi:hypothetical protein